MSETGLHVDGITDTVNPSIALKFLRSGALSANQFGMITFEEGVVNDPTFDWFKHDFMSHVHTFEAYDESVEDPAQCAPKSVIRYFSNTTKYVFQNGNYAMAELDEDGNAPTNDAGEAIDPVFPWFLRFKPIRENLPETDGDSRFFEQLVEGGDKPIAADIELFEVYALAEPNGTAEVWGSPDDEELIGHIWTTTTFTQSLWGDERLHFQHGSLETDLANMESGAEWRTEVGFSETPEYDYDTYGDWDEDVLEVPTTDDHTVIEGMYNGCPF